MAFLWQVHHFFKENDGMGLFFVGVEWYNQSAFPTE